MDAKVEFIIRSKIDLDMIYHGILLSLKEVESSIETLESMNFTIGGLRSAHSDLNRLRKEMEQCLALVKEKHTTDNGYETVLAIQP